MRNLILLTLMITCGFLFGQEPRARDIGIPFDGQPGALNAITDVSGVEVGHVTLIEGHGSLKVGEGPIRTGVTAILPRGRTFDPVYANWYSLNGNGEMTGTHWVTESGFLEMPILITNTHSVGIARDAMVDWQVKNNHYQGLDGLPDIFFSYPLVGETYDGVLNDINGFHVKKSHVFEAINSAKGGPVPEGNVGGGTGMNCLGFKGGVGTSSRLVEIKDETYTLAAIVQSNFGSKAHFTVAGVPVGKELLDTLNYEFNFGTLNGEGSIIVIVATDAPLLPHQLKRIAQRIPIGIGLVGGYGGNASGDIFLAFSTANKGAFNRSSTVEVQSMSNDLLTPLFVATAQVVEESIINAMVAAETMVGANGSKSYAMPHDLVIDLLRKYGRVK